MQPFVKALLLAPCRDSESLAITTDLKIDSFELTDQGPAIRFQTFAGQRYSVEYSPDLNLTTWFSLPGGIVLGNGQEGEVIDTGSSNQPSRFFRLKLLP